MVGIAAGCRYSTHLQLLPSPGCGKTPRSSSAQTAGTSHSQHPRADAAERGSGCAYPCPRCPSLLLLLPPPADESYAQPHVTMIAAPPPRPLPTAGPSPPPSQRAGSTRQPSTRQSLVAVAAERPARRWSSCFGPAVVKAAVCGEVLAA